MGGAQRASRPGREGSGLHPGSENRRGRREPDLRGRRIGDRRHPRQRGRGGNDHRQPAHRDRRAAAAPGQGLAQADGGAGGGVPAQVAVRGIEPRASRRRRTAARQPAQRGRGIAAAARSQDHPPSGAADLLLPHRGAGTQTPRRDAGRPARPAHRVGVPDRAEPSPRARPRARARGGGGARGPAPDARLRRRRRRAQGESSGAAR